MLRLLCGTLLALLSVLAPAEEPVAPAPARETLAWKFKVGDVLRFEAIEETRRTIHGVEQLIATEGLVWKQVVREMAENGAVTLDVTAERYWRKDLAGDVDTGDGKFQPDPLRQMLCVLVGETFQIIVHGDGWIREIRGVAELHQRAAAGPRQDPPPAGSDARGDFAAGFASGFSSAILGRYASAWQIRRFLPQQIATFLAEPIPDDNQWYYKNNIYELSHTDHDTHYIVDHLADGRAGISMEGETIPPRDGSKPEIEVAGASLKKGSVRGTIEFDNRAGRLVSLEFKCDLPGSVLTHATRITMRALEAAKEE